MTVDNCTMNKYLISKFIENSKSIQVHALSLNGCDKKICLFYVAPLAPFTHMTWLGIVQHTLFAGLFDASKY